MRATTFRRHTSRLAILIAGIACGGFLAAASPAGADSLEKAQGFDTCQAPSTSFMSNWYANSPFFSIGIYIGGNNVACSQPNLNASWVASARSDGWDFIPIWVGRQTTCYGGSYTISTNLTTAYNQGVSSGQGAGDAGQALTFGVSDPIFLDLEAASSGWTTQCLQEAEHYLQGFDVGLEPFYFSGGVYGSASGSDLAQLDSYTSGQTLDGYIADYAGSGGTTFQNNPSYTDVYGLSPVPDSDWNPNARIRQFWGNETLTYGGAGANLDQDCADAYLAGTNSAQPGC